MHSKNKIERAFRLLRLLDEKEREKFELLDTLFETIEETYIFIETSNTTQQTDKEEDHAKLE